MCIMYDASIISWVTCVEFATFAGNKYCIHPSLGVINNWFISKTEIESMNMVND